MTVDIKPIDPVNRAFFAGEVSGLDLARPLSKDEVAAVHAGMDKFGVLVFHDQKIDDDQQLVFSRSLGPLEQATGDIAAPQDRRMSMDLNDISNLDKNNQILARDDRRRLFGLGNQLWHSDSSFKPVPAKYSLLSARHIPPTGGNTEFADMRAAYDALDEATKREVHDLICLHSQIFSRGILGFTDFTDDERVKWTPVRQRLVRRHPTSGRLSLYLASHAGAIEGWPMPEARAFLRDLSEHATQRQFVYAHVWRPYDLVMWDNRATMHRARRYDHTEVRDMRRTTLTNEVSSLEQAPSAMRLQFLGSGDAFGSGGRFNTCFHLERAADGNVLIDCGASSMVAIRKWQVDPNAVSTVLVSHLHGDHFAGLPFFLLDAQLVSRRTAPLTLAGPPGFAERLMIVMEAMFAGSTKVERRFALEIRELELHQRVELDGLAVTPYLMKHYSGAPSYALRIESEGKVLTYSGDTEWVEELIPAACGADLFICEAYFFDKVMKYHIDYTTLASHLPDIGAKRTIVTHMSAELLGRRGEIALEAAHDGLVVEF